MADDPTPDAAVSEEPIAAKPRRRSSKNVQRLFIVTALPMTFGLGMWAGTQLDDGHPPTPSPVAVSNQNGGGTAAGKGPVTLSKVARRDANDQTAIGEVNAPIAMVVYSDFQCPYCGKWSDDTLPTLIEKYVNTGKVRIEFRDLPNLGPGSLVTAKNALAASNQGKYLEFHNYMFAEGSVRRDENATEEGIDMVASVLGLDVEKMKADFASEELQNRLQENINEASTYGMKGTPAFIIGTQRLSGAQPTNVFVQIIEHELAAFES